jgi:peptidoglycan L-alanyl-D-glutamate endopeptidase CwlK
MDRTSEARLTLVCPALASKIRRMADILLLEGLDIRVIQGLRSWAEQQALWLKGRDANGNIINPHEIVTNAPGGHSWHNLGLAVDCAPDDPTIAGYQIDWDANHPQWKRMEEVGRSLGLTAGADFTRLVDAPHFQLQGRFPIGAPDDEARQIYKQQGAMAFWYDAGVM